MTNKSLSDAVALLPELKSKLLDIDAPGFRGMKVVRNDMLLTIIAALESLKPIAAGHLVIPFSDVEAFTPSGADCHPGSPHATTFKIRKPCP